MGTVQFTLDGIVVEAEEGRNLLEVARENGVDIPSLCYDPRLNPFGACRLCLVEVEGARRPVPACATMVKNNMVVRTNSENIKSLRRLALELLLSNHYGDCEAPCKRACPAGIDIQGFVALIADGQYSEAARLIKESLPLPAVVGRVCPRFCEQKCRRNIVDEPLAICELKRFVGDYDLDKGELPEKKPSSGCRVAVVGGGPAGLSAAYYLALEGHEVTIFEASEKLGGMLRYGIPEYRLPKGILDRELEPIIQLCREVKYKKILGKDFTIDTLKKDGFDAVFLAIGAQSGKKLRLEGQETGNVLSGIDFLRDVALGQEISVGSKVAVVGGGNTAMDAARTAVRLGAEEVYVLYRRSEQEMPANPEELKEAREEGVIFRFLVNPTRVISNGGKITAVECVEMALGEPDESGRRRPVPVEGSQFQMKVDSLICAVGQAIDATCIAGEPGLELGKRSLINVKSELMETSVAGVFAGGDCVTGPATVVEAIAAGKKAAYAIDRYVRNKPVELPSRPYNHTKGELDEIPPEEYADRERIPRTRAVVLDPQERKKSFDEVAGGFTEEMARREASRCLSCGCQDVFDCKLRKLATEYKVNTERFGTGTYRYPIRDDHPYIVRDPNKCILCGLCARICQEVQGVSALGFVQRGFEAVVQPSLNMPLNETLCESCGQCLSVCPTGALTAKSFLPKPGPWRTTKTTTVCPYCSIGCSLELNTVGKKITGVSSQIRDTINEGNLCKKGILSYEFVHSKDRIKTPLLKRKGRFVPVDWEEAISAAASGLFRIKNLLGPEAVAVLASPNLTCEENYLAQKLARMALETNNVASLYDSVYPLFDESMLSCKASFDDIDKADLVVVFHCDPAADYPVVNNKIKRALNRGTKLLIINSRTTRLDCEAVAAAKVNEEEMETLLKGITDYLLRYDLINQDDVSLGEKSQDLAEEIKKFSLHKLGDIIRLRPSKIVKMIHLYLKAKNPVMIVDGKQISPNELRLLNLIGRVKNDYMAARKIIVLHPFGNAYGQIEAGVNPVLLPGFYSIDDETARLRLSQLWGKELPGCKGSLNIKDKIQKGDIMGALIIINDEVCLDRLVEEQTFTVVVSSVFNEKISKANVILPAAAFAESSGTFVNSEGRIQQVRQALNPYAGKENWEVIALLSQGLGYQMNYGNVSEVREEIDNLLFKGKTFFSSLCAVNK